MARRFSVRAVRCSVIGLLVVLCAQPNISTAQTRSFLQEISASKEQKYQLYQGIQNTIFKLARKSDLYSNAASFYGSLASSAELDLDREYDVAEFSSAVFAVSMLPLGFAGMLGITAAPAVAEMISVGRIAAAVGTYFGVSMTGMAVAVSATARWNPTTDSLVLEMQEGSEFRPVSIPMNEFFQSLTNVSPELMNHRETVEPSIRAEIDSRERVGWRNLLYNRTAINRATYQRDYYRYLANWNKKVEEEFQTKAAVIETSAVSLMADLDLPYYPTFEHSAYLRSALANTPKCILPNREIWGPGTELLGALGIDRTTKKEVHPLPEKICFEQIEFDDPALENGLLKIRLSGKMYETQVDIPQKFITSWLEAKPTVADDIYYVKMDIRSVDGFPPFEDIHTQFVLFMTDHNDHYRYKGSRAIVRGLREPALPEPSDDTIVLGEKTFDHDSIEVTVEYVAAPVPSPAFTIR